MSNTVASRQGHGYQPAATKHGLSWPSTAARWLQPSNATVRIAGNTTGAKSVEFIPPTSSSPAVKSECARVAASQVQLEVNTRSNRSSTRTRSIR